MKKVMIIYGSTTGNTESMSEIIMRQLESLDIDVTLKNVTEAKLADLSGAHDAVLLGCPAYGDDEIELQEDFDEFYETMSGIDLKGKKFAVFAPGDSSYEYFCGSVDVLEDKMTELGGNMIESGLKIDGDPDGEADEIESWVVSVTKRL